MGRVLGKKGRRSQWVSARSSGPSPEAWRLQLSASPAVGGAMGLGGAAATNAGLALLGGGSLAAGGLGMAGGTAVVAAETLPSLVMLGAGIGGLAMELGTPEEEVAECAKLIVLTEDVVLGIDDVEMARLIVRRLEQRLLQAEAERDAAGTPWSSVSTPHRRRAALWFSSVPSSD
ncbi:MAG: hypothetical protein U0R24_10025 [Solirubrobacterales bacterium]